MRRPTFLEGVTVAVVASLVGSVSYTALSLVFAGDAVLRMLVAGLGLAYIVYLLGRSRARVGRITAVAAWVLLAGATWLMEPPLPLYLAVHGGAVWLIRSLYRYSSVLCALADLGLSALALAAAIWAATHTGSLFLGIWCLFLVQALFVAIPSNMGRNIAQTPADLGDEDRFRRAHRSAQVAVRRLSSIH